MTLRRTVCLLATALALAAPAAADSTSLLAQARAADTPRYNTLTAKGAEIRATSDNRAFTVWWQPPGWKPGAGTIVALHGHDGWATIEAALWQPYVEKKGYAVLTLQWWFGAGESTSDYYTPEAMYPLISAALAAKGVGAGTVLFTGFSRGSANSYAVAALDNSTSGGKLFALVLSNAGGMMANYPPNQAIINGAYGSRPYAGMKWAMYCGEKDPDPQQNGCPAMTAARDSVVRYGATMQLFIDDANGDHGGFMTNAANVEQALSTYAAALAARPLTTAEADCLFDWAEDQYASALSPRRSASLSSAPYYYRYYTATRSYLGVSSADQHVWYVDAAGAMLDAGSAATWAATARCR